MYSIYKPKVVKALWQAGLSQITFILALSGALFASPHAQAIGANITVNTTSDLRGDSKCSFQEAVQAANTNAAVDACPGGSPILGDIDTIGFNISGSGIHTISVTTVTQITGPVMIDGSLQAGYSGIPLIQITGIVEDLLRFSDTADGSTLKALRLTNTNSGGLTDGATALFYSSNNRIIGNYFNTDGSSVVGPYGAGLLFDISSTDNVIGGTITADRNLFGGQVGIYLQDSSSNLIQGNFFGVQTNGITKLSGLPRNGSAIQIFNVAGNASNNTVRGNVITGFLAGINLSQGANSNTIVGNYIGVGADGSTPLSNGIGVLVYGSTNNTIGGTTASARNVISGNSSTNITLQTINASYQTTSNVIQGNYIGPNASGLATVSPGAAYGIYVTGGAANNIISGNKIAGNFDGVYIDGISAVSSGSSQNCFSGNTRYGVNNTNSGTTAPFGGNWWGSITGPTYGGNPGGTGDAISAFVNYSPFLTSAAAKCAARRHTNADFDGNGTTDVAVFRASTGGWYAKDQFALQFGGAGDIPVPGDYNGDGITDIAVYRPSNGYWYVKDQFSIQYGGTAGDIPVPGDYDGDGVTDVAIYRSIWGAWFVKDQFALQFGGAGDIPLPGDYNGDGITDVAIYRPVWGAWYVKDLFALQFGGAGDIPLPGDYNGDGITDIAVYRPSNGYWYVKDQFSIQYGGTAGDIPVPGDYDGDGVTDVAIYRSIWGAWFVKDQFAFMYGAASDFPLPARDTNADGDPYQ